MFRFLGKYSNVRQVGLSVGMLSYFHANNVQVENFYTGIILGTGTTSTNTKGGMFTNVRVAAVPTVNPLTPVCLSITAGVYDAKFIGCHFQNPPPPPNPTGKNVVVDPGTFGAASIDTVLFDSCTSTTSSAYGLEIKGGQNIQIRGGAYSGNIEGGIGITGPADNVQIIGANCNGSSQGGTAQIYGIAVTAGQAIQLVGVECSGNSNTNNGAGILIGGTVADILISGALCNGPLKAGSPQEYGVYISAMNAVISIVASKIRGNANYGIFIATGSSDAKKLFVNACDLTSNMVGPLTLSGTPPPPNPFAIEVTTCAGYNDQGTVVASTFPVGSLGVPFTGSQLGSSAYFGPIEFYVTQGTGSVSNVLIGQGTPPTNLTSGSFYLMPSETAEITGSGTIGFLAIGK